MEKICCLLVTAMFSCIHHSWDPAKSLHLMAYTSHFPPSNRKKLCALWIVINTFTAHWFCFLIPHGLTNLKFFLRCLRLYFRQSKVWVVLFFPYWEYRWTYWPAISMPYYGGKWEGTIVKRLKQRWNMKGFFVFFFLIGKERSILLRGRCYETGKISISKVFESLHMKPV